MNIRIYNWYMSNIKALQKIYGEVNYNPNNFSWIYIRRFILPPCFNQKDSALLITTPKENLMMADGFSFYLNKKLCRVDGKPITRLHENDTYNPFSREGYARLSFHIPDFRLFNEG